jgi:hypothetical protein
VIVSTAVYEDPEVQQLFAGQTYTAFPFQVPLKGFEAEEFALWRVNGLEPREESPQQESSLTAKPAAKV